MIALLLILCIVSLLAHLCNYYFFFKLLKEKDKFMSFVFDNLFYEEFDDE